MNVYIKTKWPVFLTDARNKAIECHSAWAVKIHRFTQERYSIYTCEPDSPLISNARFVDRLTGFYANEIDCPMPIWPNVSHDPLHINSIESSGVHEIAYLTFVPMLRMYYGTVWIYFRLSNGLTLWCYVSYFNLLPLVRQSILETKFK